MSSKINIRGDFRTKKVGRGSELFLPHENDIPVTFVAKTEKTSSKKYVRYLLYGLAVLLIATFVDSSLSYFIDYTISSALWFVYRYVHVFWKYLESWVVYVYLNVLEGAFIYLWNKFSGLFILLADVFRELGKFAVHSCCIC
jgi:hypothetical protein